MKEPITVSFKLKNLTFSSLFRLLKPCYSFFTFSTSSHLDSSFYSEFCCVNVTTTVQKTTIFDGPFPDIEFVTRNCNHCCHEGF